MFQDNYDVAFLKEVYGTPVVTVQELVSGNQPPGAVRVTYRSRDQFKKTAKTLGLMDDFKVSDEAIELLERKDINDSHPCLSVGRSQNRISGSRILYLQTPKSLSRTPARMEGIRYRLDMTRHSFSISITLFALAQALTPTEAM